MPTISEVSELLRKLTEKNALFVWESQQEEAFQSIKHMISETPVLKYYDVASETPIQCNVSESGLGATFLQNIQSVAFASRSLSALGCRYAQIEKERLAVGPNYSGDQPQTAGTTIPEIVKLCTETAATYISSCKLPPWITNVHC